MVCLTMPIGCVKLCKARGSSPASPAGSHVAHPSNTTSAAINAGTASRSCRPSEGLANRLENCPRDCFLILLIGRYPIRQMPHWLPLSYRIRRHRPVPGMTDQRVPSLGARVVLITQKTAEGLKSSSRAHVWSALKLINLLAKRAEITVIAAPQKRHCGRIIRYAWITDNLKGTEA